MDINLLHVIVLNALMFFAFVVFFVIVFKYLKGIENKVLDVADNSKESYEALTKQNNLAQENMSVVINELASNTKDRIDGVSDNLSKFKDEVSENLSSVQKVLNIEILAVKDIASSVYTQQEKMSHDFSSNTDALKANMNLSSNNLSEALSKAVEETSTEIQEAIGQSDRNLTQIAESQVDGFNGLAQTITSLAHELDSITATLETIHSYEQQAHKKTIAKLDSSLVTVMASFRDEMLKFENAFKGKVQSESKSISQDVRSSVKTEIDCVLEQIESSTLTTSEAINYQGKNVVERLESGDYFIISQIVEKLDEVLHDIAKNSEYIKTNINTSSNNVRDSVSKKIVDSSKTVQEAIKRSDENLAQLIEPQRDGLKVVTQTANDLVNGIESIESSLDGIQSESKSISHNIASSTSSTMKSVERAANSTSTAIDALKQVLVEKLEKGDAKVLTSSLKELNDQTNFLSSILKKNNDQISGSLSELNESVHTQSEEIVDLIMDLSFQNSTNFIKLPQYQITLSEISDHLAKLGDGEEIILSKGGITKHLTGFNLAKLEDSENGLITHFVYKDGKKARTDTFKDDVLKYQMVFDQGGRPAKSLEFGVYGKALHEYYYDAAGEVAKRIDYATNGSVKNEVNY